jgi:hypothetical protein
MAGNLFRMAGRLFEEVLAGASGCAFHCLISSQDNFNTQSRPAMKPAYLVCVLILACSTGAANAAADADREAEKAAVPTAQHPYAGFWKSDDCSDRFGLAISPAGQGMYAVSFCGPGGCFKPGTYRPNTKLVGDPNYRVLDKDTIEVRGALGFSKYVRCEKR